MSPQPVARRGILFGAVLFLVWLAWQALTGALRQLPRSRTAGQKVETALQFESGLLSLLVALTCFWRQGWAQPVRTAWSITLAAAAGLSALVWGPPMPLVGAVFSASALVVSGAVRRVLRAAIRDGHS